MSEATHSIVATVFITIHSTFSPLNRTISSISNTQFADGGSVGGVRHTVAAVDDDDGSSVDRSGGKREKRGEARTSLWDRYAEGRE